MPAVVIALSIAVLVLVVSFGVLAMSGRRTILRTLRAVEAGGEDDSTPAEQRRRYQVLLEARVYPKTYLIFGERQRISAALDQLAALPGFVPVAPPQGPSILHSNPYFTAR